MKLRLLQQQQVQLLLPFVLICVTEPVQPTVADAQKFHASIDASAIAPGGHLRCKNRAPQHHQRLTEFVAGHMLFVLLHEMADAAFNEMGLPVLGKAEDAADAFGATRLIKSGVSDRVPAAQLTGPTSPADPPELRHQNNRGEIPAGWIAPSVTASEVNGSDAQVVTEHLPAPDVLSNDADLYRKRGIAAFRDGDFHRAITELDQALRLDPNDARAYNIRGNALDEIGAFEPALADYDEAIRIDPNNPAVFHDRAILWRRKGVLDKALIDLDRAIRFSFNDAHIYCDRGLVWYEKGRHDRAIADFNRAVEIDPNFVRGYLSRGLIMHHSSE